MTDYRVSHSKRILKFIIIISLLIHSMSIRAVIKYTTADGSVVYQSEEKDLESVQILDLELDASVEKPSEFTAYASTVAAFNLNCRPVETSGLPNAANGGAAVVPLGDGFLSFLLKQD